MKMKRIAALAICVALLFSLCSVAAHADGSGNIDHGGGGGMGDGDQSWWNGDDGVRITVVRASDNQPVSRPFDMTNYNESDVQYYFSCKSKLHYRNSPTLHALTGAYTCHKPDKPIPSIITETGTSNIAAIRSYFCSSETVKNLARIIGTTYEKLTDGNYKLLLEPVAYFFYHGRHKYAMTATEAALYDEAVSGDLRAQMVSLTHQQLPLSMFLDQSDLGYPAFHGSRSSKQSDSTIIAQLGLGVVKFKAGPPSDDDSGPDTQHYRCDTDVYSSVLLSSSTEINPENPAHVTFSFSTGGSYSVSGIVVPSGDSQLVWVKWHTPSTPQTVHISVSASKGSLSSGDIAAVVEKLEEKTPPDPTATDRNDSFTAVTPPNRAAAASNSWSIWSAEPNWVWVPNWMWEIHSDWPSGGQWVDNGQWAQKGWIFNSTTYHASLSSSMTLLPDDKDPTANGKAMKSGYGVKISVTGEADSSFATAAQTAITYFPEFKYQTYWRVLDRMDTSSFAFKVNKYSTYGRRVHFTPIWYPDAAYTAYTYLEDCWTPAGMLSANLTDSTTIAGNVYDDWHVGPKLND